MATLITLGIGLSLLASLLLLAACRVAAKGDLLSYAAKGR